MKAVYYAFDGKDFDDEDECQEYELEPMRRNLGIEVIYRNGKFDLQFIYNSIGSYAPVLKDTMIAAQLRNENKTAKLKNLYRWAMDGTWTGISVNLNPNSKNLKALKESVK